MLRTIPPSTTDQPRISVDGSADAPRRGLGIDPVASAFALVALPLLWLHAELYLPFIADDALISLRYAARLVAGHGLTWSPGSPVEGYSNLLWVLLAAALGALGVDLVVAARILGMAGLGAAIVAIAYAAGARPGARPGARADGGRTASWIPAMTGMLALALSGPAAIWAVGGLEQPLLAGLLAWGLVLLYSGMDGTRFTRGRVLGIGTLFGLLALTRPDAPVLLVGSLVGLIAACRADRRMSGVAWRNALGVAAIAALFALGQVVFRIAYYGELLPNTAHAKLALTPERLAGGANYVLKWCGSVLPLLVVIGAGLLFGEPIPRSRRRLLLLAAPLALWCLYVLFVGGDIFPGRRHMLVATVMVALGTVEGARMLAARSRPMALAVVLAALTLYAPLQWLDPANRPARAERWEWDGQVVGLLLKHAFANQQPVIAVAAAGCIPYWSELPAIDMLGLNDAHIARHRTAEFGRGKIGHELGDGRYVLARRPDLVLLCDHVGGDTACFVGERELLAEPAFHREYRLLTFEGRDPHPFQARIWARLVSPRIGVRSDAAGIAIPGYLFAGEPGTAACLDQHGVFGCAIARAAPGLLTGITLPAGEWRLESDASAPLRVTLRLSRIDGSRSDATVATVVTSDATGSALRLPTTDRYDIRLWPLAAESAHLRGLRLVRISR